MHYTKQGSLGSEHMKRKVVEKNKDAICHD